MKFESVVILLSGLIVSGSQCPINEINEFNFQTIENASEYESINEFGVNIVNLTQSNLKRFTKLAGSFEITDFVLDNPNTLNQSKLFIHHPTLKQVKFMNHCGSDEIVLHGELFYGLIDLEEVTLQNLGLEMIPTNLFSNSPKLKRVKLIRNKLKNLDSQTFANNPQFTALHLGDNQFLENEPLDLTILNKRTAVILLYANVKDFGTLIPLFANPNITYISLGLSNLTNLKSSDFIRFPSERSTRLDIMALDADFPFYIDDLIADGANFSIFSKNEFKTIIPTLSVYFETNIASRSKLCNDCKFIKHAMKYHLNGKVDFNVRLNDQNIGFLLFLECEEMENHYTTEFKLNCPNECQCTYNPFLDKVWVNCHGRNLTSLPDIPYPSQFENVQSFAIDLSSNMLQSFNVSDISENVLNHLTQLDLSKNQLQSVAYTGPLHKLNVLCKDEFGNATTELYFATSINDICGITIDHPSNPSPYIKHKSLAQLESILENFQCH